MNAKKNLLYKKLFALSMTGMLASSTVTMLADHNQSPADHIEQTRSVSPANVVLLHHIKGIVTNGNSNVVEAITGGNPGIVPNLEASIAEIEGIGFASSADSLHAISMHIGAPAGATGETSLAVVLGDPYEAHEATSISDVLATIEGEDFIADDDNLHAISSNIGGATSVLAGMQIQITLNQVMSAASNSAVTSTLTGATNSASFNTAMNSVFSALSTAQATPNNANIEAARSAVTGAMGVNITTGVITSAASYQSITAGLLQLQQALANWLVFYPAP